MIDISDGLLLDAGRIAQASGVDLVLDPAAPALAGPTGQLAPLAAALQANSLDWVLTGGEDHALLATFPTGVDLPDGWAGIGHCMPGQGRVQVLGDYQPKRLGWDHFS
jgi:thiamine-monophosphate kinase